MSPFKLLESLIEADIPPYWILMIFGSLINTVADVLIWVLVLFVKR